VPPGFLFWKKNENSPIFLLDELCDLWYIIYKFSFCNIISSNSLISMYKRKLAEEGRAVEKPVKKKAAKKSDEEHGHDAETGTSDYDK
jgi:hypothetical protein